MAAMIGQLWSAMKRTKKLEKDNMDTQLNRCLTAFDLTLLGIGNMAGSGIYVLTGTVIRDKAGPAVFLSFLIAGITAFLNALCYAELGSRIPKAGSAYAYTYIAGGEFLAFIIGWSVVLEYVLSVSSVARGWSGTLDSLFNNAISNATRTHIFHETAPSPSMHNGTTGEVWISDYPDMIAFAIIMVLSAVMSTGPKLSAHFNSIITSLNIGVIILTTIIMIAHPYKGGSEFAPASLGGFTPYGFAGVIAGAGTCFYSFIGFDAITVSSEEASNPKKDMPIATAVSVSFVTILFVIGSFALVMFQPWSQVDRTAAFTMALNVRGITWATYITGIGSLLGISASLFTSIYAMPRIIYAMAMDGLIPSFFGYVHPRTQTPLIALVVFGLLAALLALLFSIDVLADFLSIGTLMAYTIVCANVCILRYRNPQLYQEQGIFPTNLVTVKASSASAYEKMKEDNEVTAEQMDSSAPQHEPGVASLNGEALTGQLKNYFKNVPILRDATPGHVPIVALVMMIVFGIGFCCLVLLGTDYLDQGSGWAVTLLVFFILGLILSLLLMTMHEQNKFFDTFKVPFVPLVPCISILLNITLIVKLSPLTWLRFAVWTGLGLFIYFGYGVWNSQERFAKEESGPLLSYRSDSQPRMDEFSDYPQNMGLPPDVVVDEMTH